VEVHRFIKTLRGKIPNGSGGTINNDGKGFFFVSTPRGQHEIGLTPFVIVCAYAYT
jgi:hypothetical protein